MIKWNIGPPDHCDAMIAQVNMSSGRIDTYICHRHENNGMLVDLEYGDDYGWDYTCVDRWILLSDILEMLNGGNFVRDPVRWFAREMEKKLRKHDHKGGWDGRTLLSLLGLCRVELDELSTAIKAFDKAPIFPHGRESFRKEVIREAADVANFVMMIADNVQIDRKED